MDWKGLSAGAGKPSSFLRGGSVGSFRGSCKPDAGWMPGDSKLTCCRGLSSDIKFPASESSIPHRASGYHYTNDEPVPPVLNYPNDEPDTLSISS